ncbi:hypothetical protein EON81_06365 [bacterium]|nr:MAG: hypothetical protein EON81_06365 [bacterium]
MPKHGFKWRTQKLKELDEAELNVLLAPHGDHRVSARLGRWIYENLATSEVTKIRALECIAWDESAPWGNAYLWRELENHKSEPFGDWVVVALTRPGVDKARDAEKFVALYADPSAHELTRGSALFGLNNSVTLARFIRTDPLSPEVWTAVRDTCAKALNDRENAYARAGACWLAHQLGGFEGELESLANDTSKVPLYGETTVADFARAD